MVFYVAIVLLPIIGAVAFIASIFALVIAVTRKKSKKAPLIALGISIVITILGYISYGTFLGA